MAVLRDIIFLVVVVFGHELGHWLLFRLSGYKPRFVLRWWGVQIGDNVVFRNMREASLIAMAGVYAGLAVWLLTFHFRHLEIYLLMCIFDLYTIVGFLILKKHQRRLSLDELYIDLAAEIRMKREAGR